MITLFVLIEEEEEEEDKEEEAVVLLLLLLATTAVDELPPVALVLTEEKCIQFFDVDNNKNVTKTVRVVL